MLALRDPFTLLPEHPPPALKPWTTDSSTFWIGLTINPFAIGYRYITYIKIAASGSIFKVALSLAEADNVPLVFGMSGISNLLCFFACIARDLMDVDELISKRLPQEGIHHVEIRFERVALGHRRDLIRIGAWCVSLDDARLLQRYATQHLSMVYNVSKIFRVDRPAPALWSSIEQGAIQGYEWKDCHHHGCVWNSGTRRRTQAVAIGCKGGIDR